MKFNNKEICASMQKVLGALSKQASSRLSQDIELITKFTDWFATQKPRGSYWQDKDRRKQAQAKMREAWKTRRNPLLLESRCSKEQFLLDSLEDVAKFVGKSYNTVVTKLSCGKGTAHFVVDDDIITVTRTQLNDK